MSSYEQPSPEQRRAILGHLARKQLQLLANVYDLEEEELAFYDAVVKNVEGLYDHALLAPLIHEVVQTIKRNLKVEWTEGHREDIRAGVRMAVKRVLIRKGVKRVLIRKGVKREDFDKIVPFVMEQAEAAYRDWPLVA